jgi:hypothetical protein
MKYQKRTFASKIMKQYNYNSFLLPLGLLQVVLARVMAQYLNELQKLQKNVEASMKPQMTSAQTLAKQKQEQRR